MTYTEACKLFKEIRAKLELDGMLKLSYVPQISAVQKQLQHLADAERVLTKDSK